MAVIKNAEMKDCLCSNIYNLNVTTGAGVCVWTPAPQLFVCLCVTEEKKKMSQLAFAWSLSWQWRTAGEKCWLREGSESQLFRVSNIGVIVCAKRLGCDFFLTLTVVALPLFTPARWAWVGQVHPSKWKQASWLYLSATVSYQFIFPETGMYPIR